MRPKCHAGAPKHVYLASGLRSVQLGRAELTGCTLACNKWALLDPTVRRRVGFGISHPKGVNPIEVGHTTSPKEAEGPNCGKNHNLLRGPANAGNNSLHDRTGHRPRRERSSEIRNLAQVSAQAGWKGVVVVLPW